MKPNRPLAFILSTGRTGTQFFESYLTETSPILCLHEPKPSRRFKFMSNMYLSNKIKGTTICKQYQKNRQDIFIQTRGNLFVESNNFIFGCIPALNQCFEEIKVLHIIRHPETYVKSHLNHGFWTGHKKFFAKNVPYWLENVPNKKSNDPILILLDRWALVNKQISLYKHNNPYFFAKFEDLFSKDLSIASSKINEIRIFLGEESLAEATNKAYLTNPKNASKKSRNQFLITDSHRQYLKDNYQDLLTEYGYSIDYEKALV